MTLNDYHDMWQTDAALPPADLDEAARNVPLLHAKWWRYYTGERLRFKKLDLDFKILKRQRWEYWSGKLDDAERLEKGWPVQPLKILSPNLPVYLESDSVLQEQEKRKAVSEETLRFIEDVIKSINNRGFAISNAINFLKFKMGV